MNDDYIKIRISSELKEKIKQAAEKDGRSMSNFIIQTVRDKLEKESDRDTNATH